MIFKLSDAEAPEGLVLVFGVRYAGSTSGRVYTYAAMKAGGQWYMTGTGNRVPQGAGWTRIEQWLQSDGRSVVWVKAATVDQLTTIWPAPEPEVDEPPGGNDPDLQ
jgi:hypothetical protein